MKSPVETLQHYFYITNIFCHTYVKLISYMNSSEIIELLNFLKSLLHSFLLISSIVEDHQKVVQLFIQPAPYHSSASFHSFPLLSQYFRTCLPRFNHQFVSDAPLTLHFHPALTDVANLTPLRSDDLGSISPTEFLINLLAVLVSLPEVTFGSQSVLRILKIIPHPNCNCSLLAS